MISPEILRRRHSVRSFLPTPVDEKAIRSLKAEITLINSLEAGMHFQLVEEDENPLKGFMNSYGMFRNARNYIAAVADTSFADYAERAGYFGEKLAMDAVNLGLGTCFVSGTYDTSKVAVQLRADWRLLFIIVIGNPAANTQTGLSGIAMRVMHRNDRTPADFYIADGVSYETAVSNFPYLPQGLAGLSSAPSARNKQPVRIHTRTVGDELMLCAYVDQPDTASLIDLGIGKFNFAAAAGGIWEWGNDAAFSLDATGAPALAQD